MTGISAPLPDRGMLYGRQRRSRQPRSLARRRGYFRLPLDWPVLASRGDAPTLPFGPGEPDVVRVVSFPILKCSPVAPYLNKLAPDVFDDAYGLSTLPAA